MEAIYLYEMSLYTLAYGVGKTELYCKSCLMMEAVFWGLKVHCEISQVLKSNPQSALSHSFLAKSNEWRGTIHLDSDFSIFTTSGPNYFNKGHSSDLKMSLAHFLEAWL